MKHNHPFYGSKPLVIAAVILFSLTTQNLFSQSRKEIDKALVNRSVSEAENAIAFIENKGQWPAHVLYRADVPGGQMLATPQGMLLGKFSPQSLEAMSEYSLKLEESFKARTAVTDLGPAPSLSGHGWRLRFIGAADATAQTIERRNESANYYNYFVGDVSTHATNVHSYSEITYKNVYPDIDVKYYTSPDGELENDIIVKPNTDASMVRLEIEGISGLSLNSKGELVLPTTVGDVVIPHPVSYLKESGTAVDVAYTVSGSNTLGFIIPSYDHSQTLVIDPIVMRWATFVSNNTDNVGHCHGIDIDVSGNIYVTGQYTTTGLIVVGAFQTTNNAIGGTNAFIGKYTEPAVPGGTGARLWQTYLGGTGGENPYALSVGLDGYPYITGLTNSNLPKTFGTGFTAGAWTQRTSTPGQQGFIAKLNPTGTGALVREIGSATNGFTIYLYDLKPFATGGGAYDIIDVGQTTQGSASADGDLPASTLPNGTANGGIGGLNGLAFRITSDFATIGWIKQYSSSGNVADQFNIADFDASGNIYVGGNTTGTAGISYNNPSAQTTRTGTQDGWLLKLNSTNGTCLWSRYFNASTGVTDILCMSMNTAKTQMVIGGLTQGLAAANITAGSYRTTYAGGTDDFFLSSIPISGASTTWGTYFGGSADESNMMGLNLDQNDDVYVLGYSLSKNITATGNPVQTNTYDAANSDAIFFKLNSAGATLLYSTYLGGTSNETDPVGERGIRFSNCRIYLAITSASNNFPFTTGTLTSTKLSAVGSLEPIIVSMANPPDLTANSITSGGTQNLVCGQTTVPITASAASYIIPGLIRTGVAQTNGTSGAYPSGIPVVSSYQWQQSTNGGAAWTNIAGATGQNYTPPANGVGTILYRRIINGDACNRDTSAIATITIAPISPPTATNNGPICSGQTLQLFASTISGATYAWTGPNGFTSTLQNPTIPSATAANTGTYSVIATITATQCSSPAATTTVTIKPGPTANAGLPRTICPNTSTTIGGQPTASGGTSPYTFLWSPVGGTVSNPVVTPASTTTYTVTVSDASNCTATSSVTVSTTLTISVTASSTTTTCGLNNGTATITPVSGTNPFTYLWSNQGTSQTITGLASGNYSVVATDAAGCTASASTSVGASVAVTLQPSSTTTTCGLNNGTATVTPLTGVGPFGYVWSNQAITQTITPVASGNYSVVATGAGGCSASASVNVGSSIAVTLQPSSTTTTCGLNNGTATVTPLTGVGPFGYVWSNQAITQTITPVASGNYSVVATGAGGCSASASVNVGSSIAVTLQPSSNTTTCGLINGTASVSPLTGVGPFGYVWSNQAITQTITPVASGNYSVVATGNGGCSASASVNLGSSIAVTLGPAFRNTTCGLNNGLASVSVITGVGPFTYLWNNSSTNFAISGLSPGAYSVTTTGNGCSASASVNVGASIAVTASTSVTGTTCGKNNGSATVNALTGTAPYAYKWSTGSIAQTISSLAPGIYKVTVNDIGKCSATANAVVSASVALTMDALPYTTTCGLNNGHITTNMLTGAGPYTYLWSNGRTTATIFSLAPATYTVTATGAAGCTASASATIGSSSPLTVTTYANNAICGINTGSAGVNIITGSAPFTYNWSNGGNTQVIQNIGSGIYKVTVTSLGGCVAKTDVTVTVEDPIPPVALCKNITVALIGNTVSIVADDVDDGSSDNCSLISKVVTPDAFDCSKLGPNSVTLTVTDGALNTASCNAIVTVIDNTPPTAICKNITVDLATSPLVITASDVDDNSTDNCTITSRLVTPASFDCTNLGDNSVTLTVTDQSGNSSSCNATVTVTVAPYDASASGGRLTCTATTIQITGGSLAQNASFSWSGPNGFISIDQNPFVTDPGTYTVTATNTANGCSSSADAIVTQDITAPDASAAGGRLTCSIRAVQVTSGSVTSGVGYKWGGPGGFTSGLQSPIVNASGTYTVTVTNTDNGCTSSADAIVTEDIAEPGATADGGRLTCAITSIQLTSSSPTAGVEYDWAGPNNFSSTDQNPFITDPGTYTVTIRNTDNGCTSSADAEATQDITPPGASATGGRLTCTVTTIQLTSSSQTSGISYEWSGPGGFSSLLQSPNTSSSGTYTVTITNTDNGCTSSAGADVTQDIGVPGASATGGRLTCTVLSIQLTSSSPTSGISYDWSGPGGFTSPLQSPNTSASGTYTVTITNTDNGCSSIATASVTQDITPPGASATGGRLTCAVTSIQLTSSTQASLVSYNWSGPGGFGSPLQSPNTSSSGTYSVTITNTDNGCTSNAGADVTQDITPPGASATGGRLTCAITSIQLTSSTQAGLVSYSWSGPGGFNSPLQSPITSTSGTYTILITNTDNGCTSSANATVTQDIAAPGASATGGRLTCAVTSIQLTSSSSASPITYSWSGPGGFNSPLQSPNTGTSGTYTILITNTDNGCTSSANATVTQNIAAPGASATGGRLTCAVLSIQLTSSSPVSTLTYSWSGPGGFTSPLQNPTVSTSGTYSVIITNTDNGCTSSATASVTQNITAPGASATGGRLTCAVTSVQLTSSSSASPITYSWSGPGGFTSPLQNPTVSTSGTYTILITNTDNGCTSSVNATVTRNINVPNVTAGGGTITCFVTCTTITASSTTPNVTYSWVGPNGFTSTQQNPTACDSGRFTVTVRDPDNGCINSANAQVSKVLPTVASCGSGGPVTSGFELDGNAIAVAPNPPDDWDMVYAGTSAPTFSTGIIADAPSNNDNYFVSGTKDIGDIPSWHYSIQATPDKDDILHAGAAQYGSRLYFFGDRYSVTGNAQIGFWFFKNAVAPQPNFTFSNLHTVGDLLILCNFTSGGGTPVILVYEWVGSGGSDGALNLIPLSGTSVYAIVNSSPTPSPWNYVPKAGPSGTFPTGAFFEGGLDLGCLPDLNLCFGSFLMETRSSSSVTAELKDFVWANFHSGTGSSKTDETDNDIIPQSGDIYLRAYPNPANEMTTFEFTAPEDGRIKIEVFNAAGAKVAEPFESNVEADNEYKVDFNTKSLASGVYIYRFTTGDKAYTRRLAVIR